jgi:predicted nucleic acid-binding protein
MILVDSNVLIDVLTNDPVWQEWSSEQLTRLGNTRQLAINPLIFAEIAIAYPDEAQLDAALPVTLVRLPLPYTAAFMAGRAFLEYRRRGGTRRLPLPDFYIGAHAAAEGHTIVTRDAARYRTYFPDVAMIAPS